MSRTIDEQIVSMQFDNRQFEKGVQTSLGTLEKLKQGLNFTGAGKGLENISAAAGKVDMSGLSAGVQTVHAKFSALEVMAVTALANITNSAVNAGKRIGSALTIDPIKAGFSEYETQLNAVQTILANTQSKGSTLEDVNSALDELNKYADQTIYNFTEMTRNIGTFTAAGVDLDKSVTSIKGIANLAAVSGSTSQQASTAMYQLSQALAAGKVQLMDWNSVVNAGMGGQVFQDALKRTAKNLGYNVDAMIEKYGSFRESLTQGEWLTAEVLTETLTQLSGAYSEADLIAQGYSKEQAKEIMELAETAVNAATKVKTFTQLIDTTKEALQSGWTQTWEILIGDFEEAKALWTKVSDTLGELINASAEARNSMLEAWAAGDGRNMTIEAFANVWEALSNIIGPIKEAFRDIFPPMTAEKLLKITENVRDLTASFRDFTERYSPQIKSTFTGIFSVLKFGIDVLVTIGKGIGELIGNLSGFGGGILEATGALGGWLTGLTEAGTVTETIAAIFDKINESVSDFVDAVRGNFQTPGFEGLLGVLQGLWDVMSSIGGKIVDIGTKIGDSLVNVFRAGDINAAMDIFNSGIFAAILLSLKKFVGGLSEAFDDATGIFGNIGEVLDGVKGALEAYQQSLQAETLKKIAVAIAILAASLFLIATIDPQRLSQSLGAITFLFANLIASLALFNAINGKYTGAFKAIGVLTAISTAVLILAGALRVVASLSLSELATGLLGVLGLTTIVVGAAKVMATNSKLIIKGAGQMILVAAALKILSSVCQELAQLSWVDLGKGLAGVTGLMATVVLFMKAMGASKFAAGTAASLILLSGAIKILASAVKDFAGMQWDEIGRGLAAMAGALAAIAVAMAIMPKAGMIGIGVGLLAVAAALVIISDVLRDMSGMTWEEIAKGLVTLGGSMLILAAALRLMTGTLGGSAALLVAAASLAILAPVLKLMGSMTWTEIAKGLITIAGAFAIIGVAGAVLTPLIPSVLALSAAIALLGVACLAIGAGLALFATGITTLAAAGAIGATSIVAAITTIVLGVAGLIPAIVQRFGDAIVVFCKVIAEAAPAIGTAFKALLLTAVDVLVECIPALANGLMKLIAGVMKALADYGPQIVDSLFVFIVGVLQQLATHLPELIQVAVDVIGAFFSGLMDALGGIDTGTVVDIIAGVGFLAVLFTALGALTSLIPSAMAGVLGMGVLIAELALVLAAVGLLAQIPGLDWLISEGGNLLQTIGTAIGQFIGGIVGGIAEGATSTLPQIGTSLSEFMTNATPFLDGIKMVDENVLNGAKTLAEAVLLLTAGSVLNSIASFLSGENNLAEFGKELAKFGGHLADYARKVKDVDGAAIKTSVDAAKDLVAIADAVPNSGGLLAKITGDNSLADFAKELISFGTNFATYSSKVSGISTANLAAVVTELDRLVKLASGMSGINFKNMSSFATGLKDLGNSGVTQFIKAFTDANSKVNKAGGDMLANLIKGVESKKSSFTKTIADILVKIMDAIKKYDSKFESEGKSLMTNFASGIGKGKTKAVDAIKAICTTMATTIRGKYESFYSAGQYLADGFAAGISANSYKAAAKARAMAARAAEAAEDELDINSPSRVGYRIGNFFGLGFVNALDDYGDAAYKASSLMARSATNGLTKVASKLADALNGEIDTNPTIRPVLDLSDISSGARTVNDLFNLSPSVGVMSNVGAISSMMNTNQNGANDDVVSAIKELGRAMSGMSGDIYQINGVTYDDGSNVYDAVRTLVRAAKVERRV